MIGVIATARIAYQVDDVFARSKKTPHFELDLTAPVKRQPLREGVYVIEARKARNLRGVRIFGTSLVSLGLLVLREFEYNVVRGRWCATSYFNLRHGQESFATIDHTAVIRLAGIREERCKS